MYSSTTPHTKEPQMTKTLRDAPTDGILKEIAKFQNAQKQYPATSEISERIGKQFLAPLFAEMARRQREGLV